jgi:hypothetical protein
MHRELVWTIVHVLLALLMIVCVVVDLVSGNIIGLAVAVIALIFNVNCAMDHYQEYQRHKLWELQNSLSKLEEAMKACWPDKESKIE